MQRPVVLIVGTRPEGIKMIPVYYALKRVGIPVVLCSTMQHDTLLSEVLDVFGVTPDVCLHVMRHNQDLFHITEAVLQRTKQVFRVHDPSVVLVQGDTTSTMVAALSAFYLRIPVGHVEAGLRTCDIRSPFPEEANRQIARVVTQHHFAPTAHAVSNLHAECVPTETIHQVGNTVVDALRIMRKKIEDNPEIVSASIRQLVKKCLERKQKIMLLTAHRRESFNGGIERILSTVKTFLSDHSDVFCFYPYHPNPNVLSAIEASRIKNASNVHVSKPLSYVDLIYLQLVADIVATDSGGIQEEAISLGKRVIVLREKTERIEGVLVDRAYLVGTDSVLISTHLKACYEQSTDAHSQHANLYGDGYSAERIVDIIEREHYAGVFATKRASGTTVHTPQ